MGNDCFCADCGLPITNERSDTALADRPPCPNGECGSLRRSYRMRCESGSYRIIGGSVEMIVTRYYDDLLDIAVDLVDKGKYGVATVIGHMACEIAVETVLLEYNQEPRTCSPGSLKKKQPKGHNLGNKENCTPFDSLTGLDVRGQNFWDALSESGRRRNKAVHSRFNPTRDEAKESLKVGRELIDYFKNQGVLPK